MDGTQTRPGTEQAWRAATHHPFLVAVRDGTLPAEALQTWLAQDALFVADLLVFQARLLARAPRPAQRVLAAGVAALVDELDWLDAQVAAPGKDAAAPLPATREYAALLTRLDAAPYPVAVTALWALEQVYLDAWNVAAPGAAAHRDLVGHWTSAGFAAYVADLRRLADQVAPARDDARVEDAVDEILRLEAAFWPSP